MKSEQRQGVDIGKRDESVWYGYDDGNRLVKTNADGTTGYTYDAAGNLIKETAPNGSVSYTYNAQNKLVKGEKSNGESSSYTYNATGARVQTVQVRENVNAGYQNSGLIDGSGGVDYIDFFSDGRNDWQKTWESEVGTIHQNNLETVTTDYIVDYLSTGNRDLIATEQGSLTKRYVYDGTGERISAEFAYADDTQRGQPGENIASDIGVGINKVWYRSSHLGSSLFTVDEAGKVIAHTIYDPWGKPLTEPTVDLNHSGMDNGNNYTGYTYDVVLDLYFAQNRFYDPQNHRFTQEDIVKDGHNWYSYVQNNPVVLIDPLGLFLQGMILYPNAKDDNVTAFMVALYDWEKSQSKKPKGGYTSYKLYRNFELMQKIKNTYPSLRNETDEKKLIAYAANEIGLQDDFRVALMEYQKYLAKNNSAFFPKNIGVIDTVTWKSLGLKLNTTLQQEFGFKNTINGKNITFQVVNNSIVINYFPKIYVCGATEGNALWKKYAEWIEKGIEDMFNSTTPIFGITPTLAINVKPSIATDKKEANIIMYNEPGQANVAGWKNLNDPGVMSLYTHYWNEDYYEFSATDIKRTAAHEFGHILGLGDAYKKSSRPVDNVNIFDNSLMKYQWDGYVFSGNDIEMLLWSIKTSQWQSYEKGDNASQAFFHGYESSK